jgi:hypothetical protein
MLKGLAILIFLSISLAALAAQSQVSQAQYTQQQANSIINNVTAYVSMVNQTGYLVFEPNLTAAYEYLNLSEGNLTTNPDLAVRYAYSAYASAQLQYEYAKRYESAEFPIVVLFTIAMLILLYKFMQPVKKAGKRR